MQLRNGMWVKTGAGIGVHVLERVAVGADGSRRLVDGAAPLRNGEHAERESWVHLVNPDGSTLASVPAAAAGGIEQASAADIPAARVAHLTEAELAALGYV